MTRRKPKNDEEPFEEFINEEPASRDKKTTGYERWTEKALHQEAEKRGIRGHEKMNKQQLVDLLRDQP